MTFAENFTTFPFTDGDLDALPLYNCCAECATYDPKTFMGFDMFSFVDMGHDGSCGYMAIGHSLGLRWKNIFKTLLDDNFFKVKIFLDLNDGIDTLDRQFWLTKSGSKFY